MSDSPELSTPAPEDIEAAADQAITACDGDAREAVKALIVANSFLEMQTIELRAAVSTGYSRGDTNCRAARIGTTDPGRLPTVKKVRQDRALIAGLSTRVLHPIDLMIKQP
jgi:hypothetical protein